MKKYIILMMSSLIIVVGVILAIIVGIVLTLTYSADQNIKCPHCELEFATDLLLLMNNSMAQCPFCHKWITIRKLQDRLEVKRSFT